MTITSDNGTDESSSVNFDAAANITTITLDDDTGLSTINLTTTTTAILTGTIDGAQQDE